MVQRICHLVQDISTLYSFHRHFSALKPVKLAFLMYANSRNGNEQAPLIILHGLFGSKQNWTSLCKAYAQKLDPPRKIIALDLRNHGESAHAEDHTYPHLSADLKRFFDDNGFSKVIVMGHSMGGACSMFFALTYPELLEKLIVIDVSPVNMSSHFSELMLILQTMDKTVMPQNISLREARNMIDTQLGEFISSKSVRAFLLTNLTTTEENSFKWRINVPTLIREFEKIVKFPQVNNVQYTGDVLFLGGGKSSSLPKNDYPKMLELFPKAKLKYIEGAGHLVHVDKPNEFLAVLSGHTGYINDVTFDTENLYLASASDDNTVKLWFTDGFKLKATFNVTSPAMVVSWHRSDSGKLLVAEKIGLIKFYNVETETPILSLDFAKSLSSAHWAPSDSQLLATLQLGEVLLWDLTNPCLPQQSAILFPENGGNVKFSPQGELLAAVNSLDGSLKVVHTMTQSLKLSASVSLPTNVQWHFYYPIVCVGDDSKLCFWKVNK